jgi:hypothetical protein
MARKRKIRQQLAEEGRFTDTAGVELGRFSYDNILVLNEEALYRWLLRAAAKYGGKVPITKVNQTFGLTGGWGADPYVAGVLENMAHNHVVKLYKDEDEIYAVWPLVPPQQAFKKLNAYATRTQYIAGLEPLE